MSTARRTPRIPPQTAWSSDAIEWEELPSLADSLAQRLTALGERHAAGAAPAPAADWEETREAALDPAVPSEPFREPLDGMAMREVNEPDVFRHFFGATRPR